MEYTKDDFLETGDAENRELSIRCRELTREYYLCDYRDEKKKAEILKELLGGIGKNVSIGNPFYCDHGKSIFIGDNVIVGANAVVTHDVCDNAVVAGIPARVISMKGKEYSSQYMYGN